MFSGTQEDPITIQGCSGVSNVFYGPAIVKGSFLVDSNSWVQVSSSEMANLGFPAGANIWKVINWLCTTNGSVVKLILNNQRSWYSNFTTLPLVVQSQF